MSAAAGHAGHTIGVAIVIESPAREVLEAARARYEPGADEMPPHITVLPPVDVDADAVPSVIAHLAGVAARTEPFRVTLRGSGSFRPLSPVVFVNVDEGAPDCADLEARVRSGDLAVESRFAYHPHVTLAHDVPEHVLDAAMSDLAQFEASMDVTAMGLYENVDGTWQLLKEFGFGESSVVVD